MPKHVAKRSKPSTVSARNFYGVAKHVAKHAIRKYGKYQISRFGKRLSDTAGKTAAKFFKSRSYSNKRNVSDILQGGSQHNDWSKRPLGNIVIKKEPVPKTVGKFYLEHSYGKVVEGGQGVQLVTTGNHMMNKNQLNGSTLTTLSSFTAYWETDPFQLNPYSTAPNNAIYTSVPAAVVADDKLCIKSVEHETRIVSLCTVPQRVKIFYYLCKKDGDNIPTTTWSEAVTAGSYLQPTAVSAPVNIAATTATPGYTTTSVIGQVPHKWATFRKFWKLVHSDQFMLQGGDQITVPVKIKVNKVITKQMLSSMNSTDNYISGLTIIPVVIVDAGLTGISTAVTTDAATCAPGYARIGMLCTEKYKFSAMPVNRFTIERSELGYIRNDVTAGEVFKIINDVDTAVAETKS